MKLITAAHLLTLIIGVCGDVYLHNPRGSNNKLSEQQNNAQNQQRLFDSQNNAAGGYQIGDNCKPVCQDANQNYDATVPGAMQGAMTYYQGSELYFEWVVQHGCGVGQNNVICQMILQYMCASDNPGIRDGTKRGNQNTAGGEQEPPDPTDAAAQELGQHESIEFYLDCKKRERNKGLYTADQNMNNNQGATATRQNPNGNNNANQRNGLECPEERDYYPYWHPTPWHDIAILTSEPVSRCEYYKNESQNVKAKGYCSKAEFNNPKTCEQGSGEWKEKDAWNQPAPECIGGMSSRDNHNGNARGGNPQYYLWKIPDYVEGRCVFRLRYNITTGDFRQTALANVKGPVTEDRTVEDFFSVDSSLNDPNPGDRRRSIFAGGPPILSQDPIADWLDLGDEYRLQLQVNTNQYGRTFQDRSHSFYVSKRPESVPENARIVNYNVRGRRGNIVQVYPSVEYDFVPQELTVEQGDYLHFQWTGSDANAKGNDGNGRQGTDRSNLVQVQNSEENVPLPLKKHTLLFDANSNPDDEEGKRLVQKFAYLDQGSVAPCDKDENNQNAKDNCKQLNGASGYFDGGLVMMKQIGTHLVASTRNNDFSNRSQKAKIKVKPRSLQALEVALLLLGLTALAASVAYVTTAVYAFRRPTSWLFSKRYRKFFPFRCIGKERLQRQVDLRKEWKQKERLRWEAFLEADSMAKTKSDGLWEAGSKRNSLQHGEADTKDKEQGQGGMADASKPALEYRFCCRCLRAVGLAGGQRLTMLCLLVLNLAAFCHGFIMHIDLGFEGSLAYPFAKGAGFALDMDLAILLLPTLKSLQTSLRGKGGRAGEWLPIDDPISFHIVCAMLVGVNSAIHIVAHILHMITITSAPPIEKDPLGLFRLSDTEQVSGASIGVQLASRAHITGILVTGLMCVMYLTALPSIRRATCCIARRCGGFRLFQRTHSLWPLVYILLLAHASHRFWIWMFFPFVFVAADRMILTQRRRYPAVLKSARLLMFDVIHLTFEVPEHFTYQAGQYIMLFWRGEWHPFTLTSAPEENQLTVHIRATDSMDWCSALRRHLTQEVPAEASGMAKPSGSVAPGTIVEYNKLELPNGTICCKAKPNSMSTEGGTSSSDKVSLDLTLTGRQDGSDSKEAVRRAKTDESESLFGGATDAPMPPGCVQLQLQGPFGAPAQRVWEFQTVMVVGAGIGVTPFVSILRSVQMRMQQQELLYASQGKSRADYELKSNQRTARSERLHGMAPPAADSFLQSDVQRDFELHSRKPRIRHEVAHGMHDSGSASESSRPRPDVLGSRALGSDLGSRLPGMPATPTSSLAAKVAEASATSGGASLLDQLVRNVIPVPKAIHFYWMVRNQQELDWFYDLLATAKQGPAQNRVEVNLFTTGEAELSSVKKLACVDHQYFGRPSWGRIFKGCKEKHKGEHIGVFLCGSPVIGVELARQSERNSDPPDLGENRTRFTFFKENF
eukprot:TRINITY_DN20799_c0_g2_i1.p1 TRINITY_DN20799_c0_g2~~TRINITY_DN20799_c0_g2_i1.p1  ORF type:complete len:1459 (-),score=258.41 TRINITY_DN20799_c0_g2_i1:61-4437(-)